MLRFPADKQGDAALAEFYNSLYKSLPLARRKFERLRNIEDESSTYEKLA